MIRVAYIGLARPKGSRSAVSSPPRSRWQAIHKALMKFKKVGLVKGGIMDRLLNELKGMLNIEDLVKASL